MHASEMLLNLNITPFDALLQEFVFSFRSRIQDSCTVAYLGFYFGGVQNFSGKVGVFAWRFSAWQSHAFARGVRGYAPPRKFLKMVQFGAF